MSNPHAWRDDAACQSYDTEQFFVEGKGAIIGNRVAKMICNGRASLDIPPCPVREQCLVWALGMEEGVGVKSRFGVFGGCTPHERAKLARKQDAA